MPSGLPRTLLASLLPLCLGAAPPPRPRLFAPGRVSTPEDEAGGSFSPDGREFYFTRILPYTTFPRYACICVSRKVDGRWTAPEMAPFSGSSLDFPPRFSPDGRALYFGSFRPMPGAAQRAFHIWRVERKADGAWGEPAALPAPINDPEGSWSLDASEDLEGTLYFASDRGERGHLQIYRARRAEGGYAEPEKLGPEVNSDFSDSQPFIAPDGSFLLFVSSGSQVPYRTRPEDINTGGAPYPRGDLYLSERRGEGWTPARHLGHGINSFAEEAYPSLGPGGELVFSSERSPFSVPAPHRMGAAELERRRQEIFNGHGNIYLAPRAALELGR